MMEGASLEPIGGQLCGFLPGGNPAMDEFS